MLSYKTQKTKSEISASECNYVNLYRQLSYKYTIWKLYNTVQILQSIFLYHKLI
jgi:hypothetical protein